MNGQSHDHTTGPTPSPLTAEQARAVGVRGTSVALRAGAGCGKTRVLSDRFLAMLEGPPRRPLGELLALTFTDKAARELRERVRRACRLRLQRDDHEDKRHWRQIVRALEAAPIGTFHAFCGRLLRRYAVAAGIDPLFEITNEALAPTLVERSVSAYLRLKVASRDPGLAQLAVDWNLGVVREVLLELITKRNATNLAEFAQLDPTQVIAGWENYWEANVLPILQSEIKRLADKCLIGIKPHDCTSVAIRERLRRLISLLPSLHHAESGRAEWSLRLKEATSAASLQGAQAKMWPSAEIYGQVKSTLSEFKTYVNDEVIARQLGSDPKVTLQCAERGRVLAGLAAGAIAALDHDKQGAGWLDYDDLPARTAALLRSNERVRQECQERIVFLLVDEFQDTDTVQADIIELLQGQRIEEGLFLVGDAKQSIYRFRGARPELFDQFADRLGEEGKLALTENFRSAAGLIDFTNALFADTFRGGGGDHKLRLGAGQPDRDAIARVEFLWASEHENPSNPTASSFSNQAQKVNAESPAIDLSADGKRKQEAKRLARRLARRLEEGWPVRDPKTGRVRDAKAGDIAILLRALTDSQAYEQALAREGLDFYIVGGAAFYAKDEVLDVIHVLSSIENPIDESALVGALRSPFFSLSDEAFFWLSEAGRAASGEDSAEPAGIIGGFEGWVDDLYHISRSDRRRLVRARLLLHRWRGLKDRLTIAELVAKVLDDSGYEAALPCEFLGDRKRANVRKIVRMARAFSAGGAFTLAEFVHKLREDARSGLREEDAATTDEEGEAVRIMSIHQSKGLEFPIVVVPDLNRASPPSTDRFALHRELGLVVRPDKLPMVADKDQPRSLGWDLFRAIESREEKAESLRLFYVATTRARDHLILSAGASAAEKPKSAALELVDLRFDRSTGNCRDQVEGDWPAPAITVVSDEPPPASTLDKRAPRPRIQPLQLARILTRRQPTEQDVETGDPTAVHRRTPRFVVLDAANTLSPSEARLDRLARDLVLKILTYEGSYDLLELAERLGRMQDPCATRGLIDEVCGRVESWLAERARRDLLVGLKPMAVSQRWSYVWDRGEGRGLGPEEVAPGSILFTGVLEFVAADPEGVRIAASIGLSEWSLPLQSLCLELAIRAAEDLGLGPIAKGVMVRLGAQGAIQPMQRMTNLEIESMFSEQR